MKTGREVYVIEKRKADGTLDLSEPQPPFIHATENQLSDYYFRLAPKTEENDYSATLEAIYGWYGEQGFRIRLKTW